MAKSGVECIIESLNDNLRREKDHREDQLLQHIISTALTAKRGKITLINHPIGNISTSSTSLARAGVRLFLRLTENLRSESQARARKLLVEGCLRLFEQGYWSDSPVDRDELEMVKFVTSRRVDIQQFEKKVTRFRRQWIQNVKFIGELYKEKILGTRVIHKCIAKLLDGSDGKFCDGSLEGFCRLLSKIGEVHSDPPEMENLPGAASRGRKLRNSKVQALEASIVQYCDK